jgi:hypothetical protein
MTKSNPITDSAVVRDMRALQELLLWARANGFRLHEVSCEGIAIKVDDLRPVQGQPGPSEPVTVHQRWARAFGIPEPEDDDEEEDKAA